MSAQITAVKEELITAVMHALSIDSVQAEPSEGAPFGRGNREVLDYALSLCGDMGMCTVMLDGYCGYADIGGGEPFGILGHLDTVPIGKCWSKNPYGEIEGGVIYGRGVMDDKGPMLSCLFALKSLLNEGLTPKRKIRFIFGSNEESGWGCIERYNQTEAMPREGFSPDADFPVINCEKGIVNYRLTAKYEGEIKLFAGERANVVPCECSVCAPAEEYLVRLLKEDNIPYFEKNGKLNFSIIGLSAHAARPWEGDNAATKALRFLNGDNALFSLYGKLNSFYGEGCSLDISDKVSGRLTVNLGIIKVSEGSIDFTLDIRYPVSFSEEEIQKRVKADFPGYALTKPHEHPPLFADKESTLVKNLLSAYKRVTGDEGAQPITIGGGTYARALKSGVAFGPQFPGTPTTIHQPDERVTVDELMLMTEIYREAIKAICF